MEFVLIVAFRVVVLEGEGYHVCTAWVLEYVFRIF
jgi:hypothetical protein